MSKYYNAQCMCLQPKTLFLRQYLSTGDQRRILAKDGRHGNRPRQELAEYEG